MGRVRIRRQRCRVKPETGDPERLFRANPGFSLYGARFLMRQKPPVDRQCPPVIAVADAGLLLAVIQQVQDQRQHLCCVGNRRRLCNRTRNICNTVMHNAVYNVPRIFMRGRAAGLDRARLVVGNIHDH